MRVTSLANGHARLFTQLIALVAFHAHSETDAGLTATFHVIYSSRGLVV